ncbi:hypothetical protein PLCT1_00259 [Planctomycetaceae bacterium]|nr:hypothetical protein PLCT1_00259 [Planctomycetaceae bacterium]
MKLRGFILAAALHGTTIALAFSLMPAQSLVVEQAGLGTIETRRPTDDFESARLPASNIAPMQRPAITLEEAAPVPVAPLAPEQEPQPEILPDPLPESPVREWTEPERQPPRLELPCVSRAPADSPAKRAASKVEPGPEGISDFVPPALLSWEVPDSLARNFRGRVVALIVVGTDGHAVSATLETGSGDSDIDRDVRKALLKARYSPARKGDQNVESTLRQPFIVK